MIGDATKPTEYSTDYWCGIVAAHGFICPVRLETRTRLYCTVLWYGICDTYGDTAVCVLDTEYKHTHTHIKIRTCDKQPSGCCIGVAVNDR